MRNKFFLHTISVTNVNQYTLNNSVHETSNRTDRHYLTISLWIRFKYSIKELTKGTRLWFHNYSWLSFGFLVLISTSDHKIGCFVQIYVHWKSQSELGLRSSIIQQLWITKDFVCRIPFSRSGFFFQKLFTIPITVLLRFFFSVSWYSRSHAFRSWQIQILALTLLRWRNSVDSLMRLSKIIQSTCIFY